VLMTKFGKADKTGCSDFGSGQSDFGSSKEGAKLKYLNIQRCFKHGKGRQGIKRSRQKKFKPKGGSHKNRMF
jgi:hypothetical protein